MKALYTLQNAEPIYDIVLLTYEWLFLQSRKVTLWVITFLSKNTASILSPLTYLEIWWNSEDLELAPHLYTKIVPTYLLGWQPRRLPIQKPWSPIWLNSFLQYPVHRLTLQNIPRTQPAPLCEMPLIQAPIISSQMMPLATRLLSDLPTYTLVLSNTIF